MMSIDQQSLHIHHYSHPSSRLSDQEFFENIPACLKYIDQYWQQVTFHFLDDHLRHVGLPHPFIAANNGIFARDQFYWDSYFVVLGIHQSHPKLAKGMVDNLLYLIDRFGMVPMRNRFFNTGGSQPPFLTSMISLVYEQTKDDVWLKEAVQKVVQEYSDFWLSDASVAEQHQVYHGLSRYIDHTVSHLGAEHESGWDVTFRFRDRALDYVPVDLNSLLYVYERDLAAWHTQLGHVDQAAFFQSAADRRQALMQTLFWSQAEEFFFDYDFSSEQLDAFYSLAGFFPLWAKVATPAQAEACRQKLAVFEYEGGLATTQSTDLMLGERRQWDYPNGWANLHWIVIEGLLNYGFEEDARRIAKKWLKLNVHIFMETNTFWEKYNVVLRDFSQSCRYPTQKGFSWSCAVFVKLIEQFYPDLINK